MVLQRRQRASSLIARLATIVVVAAGFTMTAQVTTADAVTNAVSTSTNIGYSESPGNGACLNGPSDQDSVNCNLYSAKEDVWLSGLPSDLRDGDYYLAVLEPGGQPDPNDGADGNLSIYDSRAARSFHANGDGTVSPLSGSTHVFSGGKVQLFPYDDTSNPGGVYILAVCALPADPTETVKPSSCKYDAFKVESVPIVTAEPLVVTKDALGSYVKTWTWNIDKTADKTAVHKPKGTATVNYQVAVGHDQGAVSGIEVHGTITVTNPNEGPVSGVDVTDVLSDGTVCDVVGGDDATVATGDTTFTYTCALETRPQGQLDNTATASWPDQTVVGGELPGASASFTFSDIQFAATLVDDCVAVDDSWAGTLGTVCVGDANPTTFSYARTFDVKHGCIDYDNTATFTTDDTGTTGSDSVTVRVCGPVYTCARTISFWEGKNGQGVLTGSASTDGVCNAGTYLRSFNPFSDLSATATCAEVAAYVAKVAGARGTSSNAMLKAQMMATALDVWFTGPGAYAGSKSYLPNVPISGMSIDLDHVCQTVGCTALEDASAAFGGSGSMTVAELLTWASSQSNAGGSTWYGQDKALQELARDTFESINNQIAFGP